MKILSKEYLTTLNAFLTNRCPRVSLFLTTNCVSKCGICNIWRKKKENMPLKIIKDVVNSQYIFHSIDLTGGEPILHPQIEKIIEMIKEKSFILSLDTNGILTKRLLNIVKSHKIDLLNISLDTLDSRTYKKMRGVNKLDNVMKTIKQLNSLKQNISLTFTISPFNTKKDLKDVLEFAKKENIGVFVNIYNDRNRVSSKMPIKLFKWEDIIQTNFLRGYKEWLNGKIIPCYSVRIYAEIMPNGDVFFCPYSDLPNGNLKREPFDIIWKSSRESIKKMKNCNKCFLSCNRTTDYMITKLFGSISS